MRRLPWLVILGAAAALFLYLSPACPVPCLGERKPDVLMRCGKPAIAGGDSRSASVFATSLAGYRLDRVPRDGHSFAVYTGGVLGRQCTVVIFDAHEAVVDVVQGHT